MVLIVSPTLFKLGMEKQEMRNRNRRQNWKLVTRDELRWS